MIAFLTGRLAFKAPTHLTLDVQGVGYEVHIPLSTYYALPNLDEVTALNIHTHLREDAIQLFGFLSQSEKESFLLLTSVSGIGPKLALSVLSSLPITDLVHAIQTEDVEKLATVPGNPLRMTASNPPISTPNSIAFVADKPRRSP